MPRRVRLPPAGEMADLLSYLAAALALGLAAWDAWQAFGERRHHAHLRQEMAARRAEVARLRRAGQPETAHTPQGELRPASE